MKKIILFTFAFIISYICRAQDPSLNLEFANKLTTIAEPVSAKAFIEHSKQQFTSERYAIAGAQYFRTENLLISLMEKTINKFEPFSFESKIQFYKDGEKLSSSQKVLNSEIIKSGNKNFLVVHYRFKQDEYLSVYSEVYNKDRYVFLLFQFAPEQKASANTILNTLLSKN